MGPIELFIFAVISLLLYGIIVSFSPTLFLTEVAILTRSKRPLIHTVAFMAGISIPLVLYIGLAIVLTEAGQHLQIPTARQVIGNIPIVSILAGLLLFGAGLRLKTGKQTAKISQDTHKDTSNKLFDTKTLF